MVCVGECIDVTCIWYNISDEIVVYGDIVNKEMCYVGFYWYLVSRNGLYCDMVLC